MHYFRNVIIEEGDSAVICVSKCSKITKLPIKIRFVDSFADENSNVKVVEV